MAILPEAFETPRLRLKLGFEFEDLGSVIWGLGFFGLLLGFGFEDLGFRVWDLGFRVWDLGFRVGHVTTESGEGGFRGFCVIIEICG